MSAPVNSKPSAVRVALARTVSQLWYAAAALVVCALLVSYFQVNTDWKEQRNRSNDVFSDIVSVSLWHFDYRGVEELARLTSEQWSLEKIVVRDQFGQIVLDSDPDGPDRPADRINAAIGPNGDEIGEISFWHGRPHGLLRGVLIQALAILAFGAPIIFFMHWRMKHTLSTVFGGPLRQIERVIANSSTGEYGGDVSFASYEFDKISNTFLTMMQSIEVSNRERERLSQRSADALTSLYSLMEETQQAVIVETGRGEIFAHCVTASLDRTRLSALLSVFRQERVNEASFRAHGFELLRRETVTAEVRTVEVLSSEGQFFSLRYRVLANGFHALSAVDISGLRRADSLLENVLAMTGTGIVVFSRTGASEIERGAPLSGLGALLPDGPLTFNAVAKRLLQDGPEENASIKTVLHQLDQDYIETTLLWLPDGYRCLVHRNVTEEKTLERKLAETSRMQAMGQLTSGVAHDFNNLLAVIISSLELCRHEGGEEALKSNEKLIGLAMSAALQGASITKQLLAFTSRQAIDAKRVRVDELIENGREMLATPLPADVKLRIEPGSSRYVLVDVSKLMNGLLNTILNARDAIDGQGEIVISTRDIDRMGEHGEAKGVQITIADTGPGIPPGLLEKVFEPFFSTKEHGKGTGLGLAMLHGFIEQSGGDVKIRSSPKGARIIIFLPAAAATDEDEVRAEQTEEVIDVTDDVIVIVDDNTALLELLSSAFSDRGYQVVAFSSPAEAVAALPTLTTPRALIADYQMPELNGAEVVAQYLSAFPEINSIVVSGNVTDESARLCNEAGVRHLLEKPVRLKAMMDLVESEPAAS